MLNKTYFRPYLPTHSQAGPMPAQLAKPGIQVKQPFDFDQRKTSNLNINYLELNSDYTASIQMPAPNLHKTTQITKMPRASRCEIKLFPKRA